MVWGSHASLLGGSERGRTSRCIGSLGAVACALLVLLREGAHGATVSAVASIISSVSAGRRWARVLVCMSDAVVCTM